MHTKLVVLSVLAAMGFISSGAAAGEADPPGPTLTVAGANALEEPIYHRSKLTVGATRVMLVTRDFGSGLSLQDAYLYLWLGDEWGMFAYRRTNSSKVSMHVKASALELVTKAGKTVLSLPVASIALGYDAKEH